MTTTYLPPNEAQRMLALQPYRQLQTGPQIFQAVVQLAARLFVVPISVMSIVESEHVYYLGNVGLPPIPQPLPRAECICSVAVYAGTTTVFPDLRAEPCPWLSPEAPFQTDFRFYAGQPLFDKDGFPIGTLCLLDTEARQFSEAEKEVLRRLAALAMRLLNLNLLLAHADRPSAGLWDSIRERILFSIRRIETLTALSKRASGDSAATYRQDIHAEQLLIISDIDYNISAAFARIL